MTNLMWFRRDLRVSDHPALAAALESDAVALMVLNPKQLAAAGAFPRTRFLSSVAALNESLGGKLVIRVGDPVEVLPAVAREISAQKVFASEDFTPYGMQRDAQVRVALGDVPLEFIGSPYAVAPGRVRKPDGTQYKVFTPYYKGWQAHGWRKPAAAANLSKLVTISNDDFDFTAEVELTGPVGETAALSHWAHFRDTALVSYGDNRDRADLNGTSWLSPALRFGEIHPRTLLAELGEEKGHERYRAELCWREFYADVLWHSPTALTHSLDTRFDEGMPWDSGPVAEERFDLWKQGKTGYPMVDAGIRQLLAEGWMHNRVRMIVGSFLVKHLHLPWQRGEVFFREYLQDGDPASNTLSWQWVAGAGTDAAPYVRIFNPVTQGLRFDPEGDYVRKYIPELRGLAGAAAHEPWLHPGGAPDYAERVVDIAAEREESLRRYEVIRKRP